MNSQYINTAIEYSAKHDTLLDPLEFVKVTNYPRPRVQYDALWDVLWNAMYHEQWIYVNDAIRAQIYDTATARGRYDAFALALTQADATEYIKHDNASYEAWRASLCVDHPCALAGMYPSAVGAHHNAAHVLVKPECLQVIITRANTQKGRQLCKYFVFIHKLMGVYTGYIHAYQAMKQMRRMQEIEAELDATRRRSETVEQRLILEEQEHNDTPAAPQSTGLAGYVYFIISSNYPVDGAVKIGRSVNPARRLKGLQTGIPFALQIYRQVYSDDCVELEHELHAHFASQRIAREWFKVDLADADAIVSEISGMLVSTA